MNDLNISETTIAAAVKSTVFSDGMVVNSEDLHTAMMYPLELIQMFMQAYFGCGVVCGLNVALVGAENQGNYCVRVEPGLALDCKAYPMKLCEPSIVKLTPKSCDPCNPLDFKNLPVEVFIAIRRTTIYQQPRNDASDCDNMGRDNVGQVQCRHSRAREAMQIKVFTAENLPSCLCQQLADGHRDPTQPGSDTGDNQGQGTHYDNLPDHGSSKPLAPELCSCLTDCGECHCCDCCDDSWVLLASVVVGPEGLSNLNTGVRKYVKPTQCQCSARQPMVIDTGFDYDRVANAWLKGSSGSLLNAVEQGMNRGETYLKGEYEYKKIVERTPEMLRIEALLADNNMAAEKSRLEQLRYENALLKDEFARDRRLKEILLEDEQVKARLSEIDLEALKQGAIENNDGGEHETHKVEAAASRVGRARTRKTPSKKN